MHLTDSTDILTLAAPLAGADPAGENLEYDPDFRALEDAARGKPEVQYGSTITPAEPPDWARVRTLALNLMERSRDLRIAVPFTRALLGLTGVAGLAQGLALVAALLAERWDELHPQLDPEDDMDPTLRVNTLAALVEQGGLLRELRDSPLVQVRAIGSVSLRDIEAASEQKEGEEGEHARSARAAIDAAFGAAGAEALAALDAALAAAGAAVEAIETTLAARIAAGAGLDLAPLATLLRRAAQALRPYLDLAAAAPQAQEDAAAPQEAGPARSPARGGEIAGREDVLRLLDRICAWYAQQEPSSPVPLLLQRARGLVDKNFTQLLEELAPDGLSQLAQVSGVRRDS
ncbi:hypothetical protein B0920_06275 [Massilia sp. KIM]|uniref:type VI secretion system protein TssA n=1 Tax=Massilia sp. KIM TaxID=1955422 RepID=UPI0009902C69|nr:type VI secretion system protein TssA [Massilia sp. KIM]OON63022.1 hypothetical protein B0920_06275 [Massilia sp. KIM]